MQAQMIPFVHWEFQFSEFIIPSALMFLLHSMQRIVKDEWECACELFDVLLIEFRSVMDNWSVGCLMGIPDAFKLLDPLQTSV